MSFCNEKLNPEKANFFLANKLQNFVKLAPQVKIKTLESAVDAFMQNYENLKHELEIKDVELQQVTYANQKYEECKEKYKNLTDMPSLQNKLIEPHKKSADEDTKFIFSLKEAATQGEIRVVTFVDKSTKQTISCTLLSQKQMELIATLATKIQEVPGVLESLENNALFENMSTPAMQSLSTANLLTYTFNSESITAEDSMTLQGLPISE